jgi:predicted ATP-grasp superfamily ATP-dependent carboligase
MSQPGAPANPEAAGADWPVAVIAGAFQTGVLSVRNLTRRGVRAVCFDSRPDHPGFRSVWGPARLCPNPDENPEGWLRFMLELAAELPGRPILIPSSDQFVSAIAVHADVLAERFVFSPGIELQGLLANKTTQYELAARHGMPMPLTRFVNSREELVEFTREARFPCLIKPTHFREWNRFREGHRLRHEKVAVAADESELRRLYDLASEVTPLVIAQEIIEGPDTAKRVFLSCYDGRSRRIARAMFRELRCDPLGFGPASVSEPVVDDETDEVCNRFLQALGYAGICEIEMKWDSRDGKVKLIEANPRLSGGGDAAPYAGVDLCWIHYLDLVGASVQPVEPSRAAFRHVVLRADGRAIPAYWRAGLLTWRDLMASYRPPLAFFDFDARDVRYSAETIYVAARAFLSGWLSGRS